MGDAARLLYEWGADPACESHGGVTALMAASANGHMEVFGWFCNIFGLEISAPLPVLAQSVCETGTVTTLISKRELSEGAGSYLVDGVFCDDFLKSLEHLFWELPVAEST